MYIYRLWLPFVELHSFHEQIADPKNPFVCPFRIRDYPDPFPCKGCDWNPNNPILGRGFLGYIRDNDPTFSI